MLRLFGPIFQIKICKINKSAIDFFQEQLNVHDADERMVPEAAAHAALHHTDPDGTLLHARAVRQSCNARADPPHGLVQHALQHTGPFGMHHDNKGRKF